MIYVNALASHLREYAARFLADAGLGARLDFQESPPPLPVSAERRRDLLLLLKEALNNAAKHARARTVTVRFAADAGGLTLEISDDGCGLDRSQLSTPAHQLSGGNGLRHLRKRAETAGGECMIEANGGGGTRIRVQVPVDCSGPAVA